MPTVGEVRNSGSPASARGAPPRRDTGAGESMSSFHRAVVKNVCATGAPSTSRTVR